MSHNESPVKSHDDVLEKIATEIDISPHLFEKAQNRYRSVGEWLARPDSGLSKYNPTISPQGSFALGTVTRPLTDQDEYDVDAVCSLDDSKANWTQKELKDAVGHEVRSYARTNKMNEPVEEKRRCWTLHYAENAHYHMDILPALPDAEGYRLMLEQRGYSDFTKTSGMIEQAIAITDNTSPAYAVHSGEWPQSNPEGYAAWFRGRMQAQFTRQREDVARAESANVEDIPNYRIKTPLQRAIQLLKRHRDGMFGDDELKPISIIITTLAAYAYDNEATIGDALRAILADIDTYIDKRNSQPCIANPVNPAENFADKWAEDPRKAEAFYSWLKQARQDFDLYILCHSYDAMPQQLRERLGDNLVDRALKAVSLAAAAGIAKPAIAESSEDAEEVARAQAAADERRRIGVQSKPWAAI